VSRREHHEEQLDPDQPVTYAQLDAERKLVSRLLNHPEELPAAQAKLEPWGPAALCNDQYRVVLEALVALARADVPLAGEDGKADLSAIIDELDERKVSADLWGPAEVRALALHPPVRPAEWYARIVRAAYPNRLAQETCADVSMQLAKPEAIADPLGALRGVVEAATATLEDVAGTRDGGRFREDDWSDIWERTPTEPLVEGHYSMDSNVIVWATWGLGKTTVEMDLGWHLSLSEHWRGHAVTGGHIWYVFAEGRAFIAERLKALCKRYGRDRVPSTFHTISVDVPNLLKPGEAEALARRMRAQTPAGERIVCVFLDTVSATSSGNKEDNPDMARYVSAMTTMRTVLAKDKPQVRGIHHPGWAGEHSRGGSALPAAVDTEVKILEGPGGLCVVHCEKQRGGSEKFAPFGYRVVAQAIDDEGHTGPVVKWETLRSEVVKAAKAGRLSPKVEQVYAIFQGILSEFEDNVQAGVFPNTWRQRCEDQGIDARSYRYARDELVKRGLVFQPDTTTAFFPVATQPEGEGA
jgi:hypothetical protein